ncbi:MAG: thioredoxin family protein [Candidatus Thiodiazotropha sp.]
MKKVAALIILLAIASGSWLLFKHWQHSKLPKVYDESVNANLTVESALTTARASDKPVLIIFGANWCPDCVALDQAMKEEPIAGLVADSFVVVKIDIGNFNRNMDISTRYGSVVQRGIPVAVLLSPDEEVLFATRAGELSSAKRMGRTRIYDFLSKLAKL